jgi:ABC-type multidrug transport system ATPase subunit
VKRPGIVHRLDKDTTGLLVVAKNDKAHKGLAAQFADHGRTGPLERAYRAVVWGLPLIRQGTIDAALDRVSLAATARGLHLRAYSKGMRQKVAIALAILRDTDILLLDEPTSGLDPTAIDEFHDLVRGLADAGKSILMVTHDVYGACQVADRIGLLRDGQLVDQFEAPASCRIDTETVHRAFSAKAVG